jgi:hypothetical protein
MDIFTTLSFLQARLDRINGFLDESELSLEDLIKICLKKLAPKVRDSGFYPGSLTYQPVSLSYKAIHFAMTNAEYEIYMDLKKVSKCTLSLLVAIALDLYSEKIINEFEKKQNIDSYQEIKYCIKYNIDEKCPVFIFSWDELIKEERNYHYKIE